MFIEFFLNGKIGICMNSTFIFLIAKKERSIKVKDFCPISLVTSVYKIITKVLATDLMRFFPILFLKTNVPLSLGGKFLMQPLLLMRWWMMLDLRGMKVLFLR